MTACPGHVTHESDTKSHTPVPAAPASRSQSFSPAHGDPQEVVGNSALTTISGRLVVGPYALVTMIVPKAQALEARHLRLE